MPVYRPGCTLRGRGGAAGLAHFLALLVLSRRPPTVHPACLPSLPACLQLYTEFFCRYEDPSYLKALKIDVLIAIADQTNAYEIAEEMTQVGGGGG